MSKNLTNILLRSIVKKEKLPNSYNIKQVAQAWNGLRRYKFIRRAQRNKGYELTPKGRDRLQNLTIDDIEIKNKNSWDGKWHLVIYDFPIKFKKARNAFRWKLKDLGFFQFQKSVWVYPYRCEKEILFVADFWGVRKHVEILEVNKITNDSKLRSHFNL